MQAFKFIGEMQKKTITLKQVQVKEIVLPTLKTTTATKYEPRLGSNRMKALMGDKITKGP